MTGIIFEHSGGKEHQRAPNKDNKAVNHQNRLPHQENPLLLQSLVSYRRWQYFSIATRFYPLMKGEEVKKA